MSKSIFVKSLNFLHQTCQINPRFKQKVEIKTDYSLIINKKIKINNLRYEKLGEKQEKKNIKIQKHRRGLASVNDGDRIRRK